MNTTQIKCFLTVAETLNFTKAAKQLFMTQPGLSRYITSLERELNVLLFIREKQRVRLTPAGALLAKEMKEFDSMINNIIARVQKVGEGYSGRLTIGSLGGQWLDDEFVDIYTRFIRKNPNIDLTFRQGSFRELREWLTAGEIDIAMTLEFDIQGMTEVLYERYAAGHPYLAISRHRELGHKNRITMEEMISEPMIVISPNDSRAGYELVMRFLKSMGKEKRDIRLAPNLATLMMLIEAGQGVGIVNPSSGITHKDSIVTLEMNDDNSASCCFAWMKSNYNPAISLFVQDFTG